MNIKITEHIPSVNIPLQNEEEITNNLISLVNKYRFRTAWEFLKSNSSIEYYRFYNAGVFLENLSNTYGDVVFESECIMKKSLERDISEIVKLLL